MLRSITFWTGLAILVIPLGLGFDPTNIPLFIIAVVCIMAIYSINEYFKSNETKKKYANKLISIVLSRINELKHIDATQNLRANLFSKSKDEYTMCYSYNMANDSDKNLKIPVNRGATGRCWLLKKQVFSLKDEWKAEDWLPPDISAIVKQDLEWICATPVTDENDNIVMVFCIDGNKNCTEKQSQIQKFANEMVNDIKYVLQMVGHKH